jgi:hypothetical protein
MNDGAGICGFAGEVPCPSEGWAAEATAKYPEFLTDDPPPEEIVRRITYAAHRVAHGDDYHRIARETGQDEVEVTRWAFIYAKAWDRAYPTARRAAAAMSGNRKEDLNFIACLFLIVIARTVVFRTTELIALKRNTENRCKRNQRPPMWTR